MDTAVVAGGLLLVLLVTVDAVITVLHPTHRGPVTFVTGAAVWATTRAFARAVGRPHLLSGAGPLAVVAVFGVWTALMWCGWALVYLPNLDALSYDSAVPYGAHTVLTALYVSGMSLTTVGFGDVVGATDAMRLTTVIEAAAGFGLITAAITYVLSIYPLTSNVRGVARMMQTQADDPGLAARMVVLGGSSYLQDLQQQVISVDEDTQRFPFLFYFHSQDPTASLYTLMQGAVMACLQARWGVSEEAAPYGRLAGDELRLRLHHIMDHCATNFRFRTGNQDGLALDTEDARQRLARLVRAAGEHGADACVAGVSVDDGELRDFALFVGRCQAFLDDLAEHHLYPRVRMLADE
jgi:hypothetical protein